MRYENIKNNITNDNTRLIEKCRHQVAIQHSRHCKMEQ